VDRSKLTYQNIRSICGNRAGLQWGNWTARAYLSDDDNRSNMHQMAASGNTKAKAEANLKRFLKLTTLTVRGITHTETDYEEGTRQDDPDKELKQSFEVYPAWISVVNSTLVQADDKRRDGKKTLSGKLISKRNKLFIYEDNEPHQWTADLPDLLRNVFPARGTRLV